MSKKYFLAIDQGTTGSQAILVDSETLEFVGTVKKEYPQIYPKASWVEHNLDDIWNSVEFTTKEVLKKYQVMPQDILSIGITNQRETTCAFTKEGRPLYNAIVWQDRRTAQFCEENKSKSIEIKTITGLPLDPYFSATKMRWFLNEVPEVNKLSGSPGLKFGTIDTFLLYKLTNGESYFTDTTNASRTLLMNLKTSNWDKFCLDFFKIDEINLPIIKDTFTNFGKTKNLSFLPDGIPITCVFGDQQSALFGQGVTTTGGMKCTYGTGAFLLLNIGEDIRYSEQGLLTTSAYQYQGKKYYAFEGACYIAGAAVQWLRDNLKIINSSIEVENLARKISPQDIDQLFFMPFFSGLGSPYWRPEARASIIGLTRDTKDEHLALACLEGIAFSIFDLVSAFEKDAKNKITSLNVDGGACKNNLLMEIQSAILESKIIRPKITETTGFGAALGAAVGLGHISIDKISSLVKTEKEFTPNLDLAKFYKIKKSNWSKNISKIYL